MKILLTIILVLVFAPAVSAQEVVEYVDGYQGNVFTAEDNLLNSSFPTLNFGQHGQFEFSPTQNAIFRFNLSAIPASAGCVDATLYLYKTDSRYANTITSTVYSLTQANTGWVAGTGNGDPAVAGESTWGSKVAGGVGGIDIPWAGTAGLMSAGIDYDSDPLGSWIYHGDDPIGTEYAIPLDPSRIRSWFGPNNTNYGILIMTTGGNAKHLAQAEYIVTAYRPKLVVHYINRQLDYRDFQLFLPTFNPPAVNIFNLNRLISLIYR